MDACRQMLQESFKPYAVFVSGVLFGLGWWVWGDAVAVSAVSGLPFQAIYLVPGIVATLAILVMNCVPREELQESVYGDDASMCRSRLALFVSYVFSVASIAGAIALLLSLKSQGSGDLWPGVASVIQSSLIVGSGLVSWFFRDSDSSGYSYMY